MELRTVTMSTGYQSAVMSPPQVKPHYVSARFCRGSRGRHGDERWGRGITLTTAASSSKGNRVRQWLRAAGVWHGAVAVALVLLPLAFGGAWAASSDAEICRVPDSAISFSDAPNGSGDGSSILFRRVDVRGLGSVVSASPAKVIDFPVRGSRIRFFYVRKILDQYNSEFELVGCLNFTTNMRSYVLTNTFDSEGGAEPVIMSMFALDLMRDIGHTLFIILRWDNNGVDDSGYFYSVMAFGINGILRRRSTSNWNYFRLFKLSRDAFGDVFGLDGSSDAGRSDYPYKDKAAVVKRLKNLGYLK